MPAGGVCVSVKRSNHEITCLKSHTGRVQTSIAHLPPTRTVPWEQLWTTCKADKHLLQILQLYTIPDAIETSWRKYAARIKSTQPSSSWQSWNYRITLAWKNTGALYECLVWETVIGLVLQKQDTTVIFSVCRHTKEQSAILCVTIRHLAQRKQTNHCASAMQKKETGIRKLHKESRQSKRPVNVPTASITRSDCAHICKHSNGCRDGCAESGTKIAHACEREQDEVLKKTLIYAEQHDSITQEWQRNQWCHHCRLFVRLPWHTSSTDCCSKDCANSFAEFFACFLNLRTGYAHRELLVCMSCS